MTFTAALFLLLAQGELDQLASLGKIASALGVVGVLAVANYVQRQDNLKLQDKITRLQESKDAELKVANDARLNDLRETIKLLNNDNAASKG